MLEMHLHIRSDMPQVIGLQVSRLQAGNAQIRELQGRLGEKDRELERMRADLEAALREEITDSDPARLRAARQRVSELERDLAAKEVTICL